MRQDQSFPAQVELLLCDKPVRLWRLVSENETKCSNFEQNMFTKFQKAAGVRIVPDPLLEKFRKTLKKIANFAEQVPQSVLYETLLKLESVQK